jgi:hypothetical protein
LPLENILVNPHRLDAERIMRKLDMPKPVRVENGKTSRERSDPARSLF